MDKIIRTPEDLFNILLHFKFKKNPIKPNEKYTFVDKDFDTDKNFDIIKSLLVLLSNMENDITFVNKLTTYKIFNITNNYDHFRSMLIGKENICKVINDPYISIYSIYNNMVYFIDDDKLSRHFLDIILNIYTGINYRNCCIIFTINHKKYCLSKSLNDIYYRKNSKGKLCLCINNECWEY